MFPLVGKHADAECERCHAGGAFTEVAGSACVDCHGAKHGGQTACGECHTPAEWVLIGTFLHVPEPLDGAHATPACWDCHPGLDFSTPIPEDSDCAGCHGAAPHVGPGDCAACHTPTEWSDVVYIHVPMSYHDPGINSVCETCHTTGSFIEYTCTDCHADERLYDPDEEP